MRRRLRRILLIDDNPADNFLHERVIRKVDCAERVDVCETAMAALDFLTTEIDGAPPCPELVLLDINMPGMTGWEFLAAHRALPEKYRGHVVIAMLTVSPNPADAAASARFPELAAYANKPLTRAMLEGLLDRHFPGLREG